MSDFIRQNRIAVWLLVTILAFPLAVKSAHIHHYEDNAKTSSHHHSCDDCLICHFELYAYTETVSSGITPQLTPIPFTPAPVQEKIHTSPATSHSPRAPPVAQ